MVRDKTEAHLQGGARRGRAKRSVSIHWRQGLPQEAGKQPQGGEDSLGPPKSAAPPRSCLSLPCFQVHTPG